MAIIEEKVVRKSSNRTLSENISSYILNANKCRCRFCGGTMVRDDMVDSIAEVAVAYGEKEAIQLKHFVLSFSKDEQVDAAKANAIGKKIIEILGYAHQALYAVHDNTDTLHIHILVNPISYLDGRHFCETEQDYQHFIAFLAHLLYYDFRINTMEKIAD